MVQHEKVQIAQDVLRSSLEPSALLQVPDKTLPNDVTSLAQDSGLLTDGELHLTAAYDATDLLRKLEAKDVSAQELLQAFRKRATIAHQGTNCLTELITEAWKDAKACDDYLAQHGTTTGPLHGLPISLKEQIAVAGHYTNGGFVAWADNLSTQDAHMVRTLRKLGAVVFARTNQPQALMHLETSNNIYGVTTNPRDRTTTAGGSTGGEAALMAMYGSPLGIGGDIGGSIRVPAALNNIYGLKPSVGRISGIGALIAMPGCDAIIGTLGPMARSARDLELFCRAYSDTQPWIDDISLIPGSMTALSSPSPTSNKVLRVGWLANDGVVTPLPPVQNIMRQIYRKLVSHPQIQIQDFEPYDHARAWQVIAANYFESSASTIIDICKESDEPVLPLTEWLIQETEAREKEVAPTIHGRRQARNEYRQLYNEHWNRAGIDVLIAPVTPGTAPKLGTSKYWGYTSVWNLLDYPAVAFPASTLVGGYQGDLQAEAYRPKNEIERQIFETYSPEESIRMPVGLQIVAKRLHEGDLLAALRLVETAIAGHPSERCDGGVSK